MLDLLRGQEVYSFFFLYGKKGIIGIFLACIIMGIVIYKTLKIIKENDTKNYDEFLNSLLKNDKITKITNIVTSFFILISFYVMIAGFGAYLNQEFNLNSIIGSSILALLCYFIFENEISGIIKANEILIPALIVIIGIIRIP